MNKSPFLCIGVTLALAVLSFATLAQAQDYGAMLEHQKRLMNENIARGQQMVEQNVRQRMQDPQVQASYRQYVARSGGRPAMDYPTFTYQYIYTNGFSAQGIAHARSVEAGNQAREQAAWQGLQQAQAERGQAQQGLQESRFRNQQEAGRGLMGQSTYVVPNGTALALPHTWQRNSVHDYQGQRYRVDAGGNYAVLGADGWWYPLAPGR